MALQLQYCAIQPLVKYKTAAGVNQKKVLDLFWWYLG